MTNGCELSREALTNRSARVLQHPGWVPNTVREPMKGSNPETKEGDDRQLIEDINQLNRIALGEGAVTCVACGSRLFEGREVLVYAYRPAGAPRYGVGYVRCAEHDEQHCLDTTSEDAPDTIGVRELVVQGRIGTCTDVRTQVARLVLLDPTPVVVSDETTKTGREVGVEEYTDTDGQEGRL